jgi:hypothetical protein
MARYALPFGYVDWPDPDDRHAPTRPSLADAEVEPTTRLTVRIPRTLRRRVEESAALEGVPADAWILRSLRRSIDPRLELG